MAKKNPKTVERRAMVEKMRQDQARKERTRSMIILGVCVVVVLGLLTAALIPYLKDQRAKSKVAGTAVEKIGASTSAASCGSVIKKAPTGTARSGANGNHVNTGTKITYPDAPPAFGQHWPNFLSGPEIRNFYSTQDRPEVERLVHSLEHGHTMIWYDDTIKSGSQEYKDLEAIAAKYAGTSTYVNIVPWKSSDGASFPAGKHVAMTHWTANGSDQEGVWQYCGKASGSAISSFVKKYPNTDAPEAGSE